MPSTPIVSTCTVAGVVVKHIGHILQCPACGQRTRCRHTLKRHFGQQTVDREGKIRCVKMVDEGLNALSSDEVQGTDVQEDGYASPEGPWPADGGDWEVGDIAASMLECLSDYHAHGQEYISSTCELPEDHHAGRPRGGVEAEDPLDAAEFFNQYGLPNLLSDDEDEDHDGDSCADGVAGWPVHQLLKPLYPGSHYNVQQYAYAMFKIKTGSIRDDRADQLCKIIAEIMPRGFEGPRFVGCRLVGLGTVNWASIQGLQCSAGVYMISREPTTCSQQPNMSSTCVPSSIAVGCSQSCPSANGMQTETKCVNTVGLGDDSSRELVTCRLPNGVQHSCSTSQ